MYKRRGHCRLHECYVDFLRKKESERMEAHRKRKEELVKKQEEHAFSQKLQRERDRMIALHIKKQTTLQSQVRQL